ncbi:MAG: SAM-dependent methyltransferase, partial [Candidatus Altiarchaeota archaeon]|nr:SAM-dependent methyltransferase [Candidatus Altiarchaeota archaeon]
MESFIYKPIGIIHTPFSSREGMPIQGGLHQDSKGEVEVFREYTEGLLDLDGFSHIILMYAFNKSEGYSLKQKPFLDDKEHGVFAIRSPKRPNAIGLTTVAVEKVTDNII